MSGYGIQKRTKELKMAEKPKTGRFTTRQYVMAGIGIVFAIAAYISGGHIIHTAMHYGQTLASAALLPAILDVFGLFCAVRLRLPNISGIARTLARIGMWFTLTTSLWFNIESALITNVALTGIDLAKALFISSIPALVIMLAAEILTHVRKSPTSSPSKAPRKAAATPKPATVTAPRQRAKKAAEKPAQPELTESATR